MTFFLLTVISVFEPENILYRSSSPKSDVVITDFGLAKYLKNPDSQSMTSVCGTPLYAGKVLTIVTNLSKVI